MCCCCCCCCCCQFVIVGSVGNGVGSVVNVSVGGIIPSLSSLDVFIVIVVGVGVVIIIFTGVGVVIITVAGVVVVMTIVTGVVVVGVTKGERAPVVTSLELRFLLSSDPKLILCLQPKHFLSLPQHPPSLL